MEIERKFLLSKLPDLEVDEKTIIYQAYLSTNPEVRIRKKVFYSDKKPNYKMTLKSDGLLSRKETEFDLTQEQFEKASSTLTKPFIRKDYYKLRIPNTEYYFDCGIVDKGEYFSFMYGEIEFPTEEEANKFVLPDKISSCIIKEVTDDTAYKMKNIWKYRLSH